MATFEKIASAEAGSGGTTTFDFQNILPNWTDLVIKLSARTTDLNSITVDISLNNSASNFTTLYLQGAGSGTPASGSLARFAGQGVGSSFTSNTFSNGEIYIPNYLSTVAKSYSADTVTENNATLSYATLLAGLWNPSTQAAINRVTLTASAGTLVQYSSCYLYGIKKA